MVMLQLLNFPSPVKALLKNGLLPIILQAVLNIMATPTEEEGDDPVESQSPISVAAQVGGGVWYYVI